MVRFGKLKTVLLAGAVLGMVTFGTVYASAQEESAGVSVPHGQNMDQMMTGGHETEMNMSGDHGQSQESAAGGHGDSKGEEPVPWGFLYGFLAVNGAVIITAGVMKLSKQRTVQEVQS